MNKADEYSHLLDKLIPVAIEAGRIILDVREAGIEAMKKDDKSPVTEADRKAEAAILARIAALLPSAPVVAEERADARGLPEEGARQFWLVDPLDGTKEFIRGGSDFTVNIALIEDGRPMLGVVLAPADGRLFAGSNTAGAFRGQVADNALAERQPIRCRSAGDPLTIVASRSHRNAETEAYLAHYPDAETVSVGSSLKFCLVAEGTADLYPRLGPTMEWDTAAGHAVLAAAGGSVVDEAGAPFGYNKPGFRNGFFLAYGDPALDPVTIRDAL